MSSITTGFVAHRTVPGQFPDDYDDDDYDEYDDNDDYDDDGDDYDDVILEQCQQVSLVVMMMLSWR